MKRSFDGNFKSQLPTISLQSRKHNFSAPILESISRVSNEEELQDYKVQVGNTVFGCHRLILCACSEFFQCLMRSSMIESKTNYVQLKDVGSETFSLILKMLYTGSDLITKDNFLEVWRAADQLRIVFLIAKCEEMATSCIREETCGKIYQTAKLLESMPVLEQLCAFMIKNFKQIRDNGTLSLLEFDEFLKIISHDELQVPSEDFVLFAIFDWVRNVDQKSDDDLNIGDFERKIDNGLDEKGLVSGVDCGKDENIPGKEDCKMNDIRESLDTTPHAVPVYCSNLVHYPVRGHNMKEDRKVYLSRLVKASRYDFASVQCLSELFMHPLTQNDPETRMVIFLAVLDKVKVVKRRVQRRPGPWCLDTDRITTRLIVLIALSCIVLCLSWVNESNNKL